MTMRLILAATAAAALMAPAAMAADVESGKEVFARCKACHQVGPGAKNGQGPMLNGIFGRKAGTVEGFPYSDANKGSGVTWDEATFTKYIKDPRAFMPGNKMAFAGLKDDLDIADLIAFLKQYDAAGKTK